MTLKRVNLLGNGLNICITMRFLMVSQSQFFKLIDSTKDFSFLDIFKNVQFKKVLCILIFYLEFARECSQNSFETLKCCEHNFPKKRDIFLDILAL